MLAIQIWCEIMMAKLKQEYRPVYESLSKCSVLKITTISKNLKLVFQFAMKRIYFILVHTVQYSGPFELL